MNDLLLDNTDVFTAMCLALAYAFFSSAARAVRLGRHYFDEAEARQTISSGSVASLWPPLEKFTIHIGAVDGRTTGYKRFTVTNGKDRVTFTAEELMAALKAER